MNNKKEIKYSIILWHYLTIVYMLLAVGNIMFGVMSVYCAVETFILKRYPVGLLDCIVFCAELFMLFSFYLLRSFMIKSGADARNVDPYICTIQKLDKEALLAGIKESLQLEILSQQIMCSFSRGKENTLFILYFISRFEKTSFNEIEQAAVKNARRKYGLKDSISISEARRTAHINIVAIDSFDEKVVNAASINAMYGMGKPVSVLNLYIDLENMQVFLPRYCSVLNGGSSRYVASLKTLYKLFYTTKWFNTSANNVGS